MDYKAGDVITFDYINYEGKKDKRHCLIKRIYVGVTEYYTEIQLLVKCYDYGKKAIRTFAKANMSNIKKA